MPRADLFRHATPFERRTDVPVAVAVQRLALVRLRAPINRSVSRVLGHVRSCRLGLVRSPFGSYQRADSDDEACPEQPRCDHPPRQRGRRTLGREGIVYSSDERSLADRLALAGHESCNDDGHCEQRPPERQPEARYA
jgi:hypothetical protein